MIHFYTTDPLGRLLLGVLVALLLVGVALGTIGFIRNWNGFVENLAAELVGLLVTIVVGFVVVDGLVRLRDERRREQEWSKVRKTTLAAMSTRLTETAFFAVVYLPINDQALQRSLGSALGSPGVPCEPTSSVLDGIETLRTHIDRLASQMTEGEFAPHAEKFYDIATWGLDQIQGILIPRIIHSSPDQELIDACIAFDDARSRLHIATVARSRGKVYNFFPNMQDLFTTASAVYDMLCSRWEVA